MRPDFAKVVTEVPRSGSQRKNRKTRFRLTANTYRADVHDDLPVREKMCRRNREGDDWGWKEPANLLGPIYGFLRSRVGQLWDNVYSEIRSVISSDAPEPARHVLEVHIKGEVVRDCFLGDDGYIYHIARYSGLQPIEEFFVHPKTRRLEYREPTPRKKQVVLTMGKGSQVLTWKDPDTGMSIAEADLVVKVDYLTRAQKIKGL